MPRHSWNHACERYLRRNRIKGDWSIQGFQPHPNLKGVILIPALAEADELFATLNALEQNPATYLGKFLILVIVNHCCNAELSSINQNRADLKQLQCMSQYTPLQLGWIDAASSTTCLPAKKGGVGMARRIGADLVLPAISADTLLVHLDADTRVERNYLKTLTDCAELRSFNAGVIHFEHQRSHNPMHQCAIEDYELYLRCHAAGLKWAGSPYAYISLGSTMVSRAAAYIQAGGMNLRKAGEDFYFLQQLAKTAGIQQISGTCVYPSARLSERTPFGTGQNLRLSSSAHEPLRQFYPFECYALLRVWLHCVDANPAASAIDIIAQLSCHSEVAAKFIIESGFEYTWERLQKNHANADKRRGAFHEWFDALKTWRFIRTLGEQGANLEKSRHGPGPITAAEAITSFAALLNPEDIPPRYLPQAGLKQDYSASMSDFQ